MDQAPRGPLVSNEKSGTLDFTDNYKQKWRAFREGSREQADRELRNNKEWGRMAEYIRALEGDQWPANRAKFRSKYVDNHLSRARKETLAQYTDVKPVISVQSTNDFAKQAEILKKMLMHSWINEDLDLKLTGVLDHALFNTGYWKLNAAQGRVSVITCGMDTVKPINCTGDIQESSAIRYSVYKPVAYFYEKFGEEIADKVLRSSKQFRRDQPESNASFQSVGMNEYSWNRLSPSMRYVNRDMSAEWGRTQQLPVFPVAELEELWFKDYNVNETRRDVLVKHPGLSTDKHNYWYRVKPGQRLYPRKRLMVFGGDENLYDSTSPYWYEGYPFAKLCLDPIVWGAGGLSKYRNLLPINCGMNEISAGVFDTIKKAINQAYVAKRGSVVPADWDRFFPEIPGQRILMNNTADIRDIRALDPPNLPAYVFEFSRYLMGSFDRHAGSTDMGQLMKKKQVPGGEAMEQIRDAQSAPIRYEGRFIETFLRDAGRIAVSHYLQYFNRKDRYWILGDDGVTWSDYEWDPSTMIPANQARETFYQLYRIIIAPGSLHGANKDRDQTKALILFRSGALSLETLLTKADIGNVQEEITKIAKERELGLIPGGAQGRTPRMTRGQRNGQAA